MTLVTPRRFDLAVKVRYFESLLHGGDPDALRLYRWHIAERSGHRMSMGVPTDRWKKSLDDYVSAAEALLASMVAKGFDSAFAVPVDPNGELLDGSHRVACALALQIKSIVVRHEDRLAWAPPWGEQWFMDHGIGAEDLERLRH